MPGDITLSCEQLQAVIMSTFKSACGDVRFQYLSGPITGGRNFVEWQRSTGHMIEDQVAWRAACKVGVIMPHCAALARLAAVERTGTAPTPTIEPGSFEANFNQETGKWGQSDYYALWDQVIAAHASRVKFCDGWEYSVGCTYEYACAQKHGTLAVDQQGKTLLPADALRLIDDAVCALPDADQRIVKLRRGLAEQRDVIASFAAE